MATTPALERLHAALPLLAVVLGYALVAWVQTPGLFSGELLWDERLSEYIPWRIEAARLLASGELPFYTPRVFGGMPLFSTAYVGCLYPPNWLYVLFGAELANPLEFLHNVAGALGLYLYLRSHAIARTAAFLGGLILLSGSYLTVHSPFVSMHEAACWMPWVALSARMLLRRPEPGRLALFAALLAMQIAVGYVQNVLMTLVWVGLVEVPLRARASRRFALECGALAAGVATALLLAGVQILPTLAHARETPRDTMTMAMWQEGSFPPQAVVWFALPRALGSPITGWRTFQDWGEIWSYTTSAAPALGLCAAWAAFAGGVRRRRRLVALLAFGVVVTVLLAMGRHFAPNALLFHVPPFGMFRIPARWLLLTTVFLAILAALGLHLLLRGRRTGPDRAALAVGAWCAWMAAVLVAFYAQRALSGEPLAVAFGHVWAAFEAPAAWPIPMQRLLGLGAPTVLDSNLGHVLAAVVVLVGCGLARRAPGAAGALWVLAFAFESRLVFDHAHQVPMQRDRHTEPLQSPVLAAVSPAEVVRLFPLTPRGQIEDADSLPHNTHLFPGLPSLGGYTPLLSKRLPRVLAIGQIGASWRDAELYANPAPLEQLAVSHVLVMPERLSPEREAGWRANLGTRFVPVGRAGEVTIARLPQAMPRFAFAPLWLPLEAGDAERAIHWAGAPPVRERPVLIDGADPALFPPAGKLHTGGIVTVRRERAGQLRLRVSAGEAGVLVVRDVWWPGWRYRISGRGEAPRPVFRANGIVMAVPVPAGTHTVELEYRPPGLARGLVVSAVGLSVLLGLCGAAAWNARRKTRRPGGLPVSAA